MSHQFVDSVDVNAIAKVLTLWLSGFVLFFVFYKLDRDHNKTLTHCMCVIMMCFSMSF